LLKELRPFSSFDGAGLTNQGHNLIGVGGAGFTNGVKGDLVGTRDNTIDPRLGPSP